MTKSKLHSNRSKGANRPHQSPKKTARLGRGTDDGKLSPWEAEAIMSADLPSGDPELTPPASSADQSPDFQPNFQKEKLDVEREDENKAA